jgi:hypothetical protein
MPKITRQAAPPLTDRDKRLPEQLQRSLKRSEEQLQDLRRKIKEAAPDPSPPDGS